MAKPKKWSEQLLIEETRKTQDENGNEIEKTVRELMVCTGGLTLFRKNFTDDKYKDKNKLAAPFDFIVVEGDMCPKGGEFYELEYTIGEYGTVYRALIQVGNPVTDLRIVIGSLRRNNVLPKDFTAQRAWHRDDIDIVCIGNCFKDETGEVTFGYGAYESKGNKDSILVYSKEYHSACLYYYRGDHREYWTGMEDYDNEAQIFVCGSDNVNDPAFADRREADMQELDCLLDQVKDIISIYNLSHFYAIETGMDASGNATFDISSNISEDIIRKAVDAIYTHKE